MKLFISYSRDDKNYVYELARLLKDDADYDVWIDRRLSGADLWWETILDEIEQADCFIMMMTPRSTASIYCQEELKYALALKKPIIPLMLKFTELPPQLKPVQYLDIEDVPLYRALFLCTRAVSKIERRLYEGRYPKPKVKPQRPTVPELGSSDLEHIYLVFAAAEEAAAESKSKLAKTLFEKVAEADPYGLGLVARNRLDELNADHDRLLAYGAVQRLAANPVTIQGARVAWQAFVQKYGDDYDPENLGAILGTVEAPPRPKEVAVAAAGYTAPKVLMSKCPMVATAAVSLIHLPMASEKSATYSAAYDEKVSGITTQQPSVLTHQVSQVPESASRETTDQAPIVVSNTYQSTLLSVTDIMPGPLKWCLIPEGKVTLEDVRRRGGTSGGVFHVPQFVIAKYPVTNAQFKVFLKASDGYVDSRWWSFSPDAQHWHSANPQAKYPIFMGDAIPATSVNWYDSVAFCLWLSEKLGRRIMLPTEAQWQRAAQGNDARCYPWGDYFNARHCNTKESGLRLPADVASHPSGASPFGVMDMSGNVREWCVTKWETGADTLMGDDCRVLRGGSFYGGSQRAKCTYRSKGQPTVRLSSYGFRIVLVE